MWPSENKVLTEQTYLLEEVFVLRLQMIQVLCYNFKDSTEHM